MGKLLVELADEIPPVVVDSRRPQAIFLMQENYFGSVMFGALSPREAISQYREAMNETTLGQTVNNFLSSNERIAESQPP